MPIDTNNKPDEWDAEELQECMDFIESGDLDGLMTLEDDPNEDQQLSLFPGGLPMRFLALLIVLVPAVVQAQTVTVTGFVDPDTGMASRWNGSWSLSSPTTIDGTRHYTLRHPNPNVWPKFLTLSETRGRWSVGIRDNIHQVHEPGRPNVVHHGSVWANGRKRLLPSKIRNPLFVIR